MAELPLTLQVQNAMDLLQSRLKSYESSQWLQWDLYQALEIRFCTIQVNGSFAANGSGVRGGLGCTVAWTLGHQFLSRNLSWKWWVLPKSEWQGSQTKGDLERVQCYSCFAKKRRGTAFPNSSPSSSAGGVRALLLFQTTSTTGEHNPAPLKCFQQITFLGHFPLISVSTAANQYY